MNRYNQNEYVTVRRVVYGDNPKYFGIGTEVTGPPDPPYHEKGNRRRSRHAILQGNRKTGNRKTANKKGRSA